MNWLWKFTDDPALTALRKVKKFCRYCGGKLVDGNLPTGQFDEYTGEPEMLRNPHCEACGRLSFPDRRD